MQHKRQHNKTGIKLLVLVLVVLAGIGLLATSNPQAPAKPVEKQLDAKAFLGTKE